MHATLIHGDHDIRLEEVPDPVLVTGDDAIVRVVAACVCGSDLWPYRGVSTSVGRIGHEFVGIVESVGADETALLAALKAAGYPAERRLEPIG